MVTCIPVPNLQRIDRDDALRSGLSSFVGSDVLCNGQEIIDKATCTVVCNNKMYQPGNHYEMNVTFNSVKSESNAVSSLVQAACLS